MRWRLSEGRAKFWAVEAEDNDAVIHFVFPNGMELHSRILESAPPRRFSIKYFGGSVVVFDLESDGAGGTDITMTETGFASDEDRQINIPGWISVLPALKAAIDFGIDLRNADAQRTWDHGFVDVVIILMGAGISRANRPRVRLGPGAIKTLPLVVASSESWAIISISRCGDRQTRGEPPAGRRKQTVTTVGWPPPWFQPAGGEPLGTPRGKLPRRRVVTPVTAGTVHTLQGGDSVNLLCDCTKGLHA